MIRAAFAVLVLMLAQGVRAETPLPLALGGPFDLIDQDGNARGRIDPDGRAQLLYFGYANCPGICTTAMPMMAEVSNILAARGIALTPVMITVDPTRDRVGTMGEPLRALHPRFTGLTGSEAALARAYKAFSVEKRLAFIDPERGAIYAHGSFIYLLSAKGEVLTLFPPILDARHVADLVAGYLTN